MGAQHAVDPAEPVRVQRNVGRCADLPRLGNRGILRAVRAPSPDEVKQWRQEFDAAARRPLKTRLRYAFVHTYKPVLDDARYRSFDTMAEYRAWCERELPRWLGYGQDL